MESRRTVKQSSSSNCERESSDLHNKLYSIFWHRWQSDPLARRPAPSSLEGHLPDLMAQFTLEQVLDLPKSSRNFKSSDTCSPATNSNVHPFHQSSKSRHLDFQIFRNSHVLQRPSVGAEWKIRHQLSINPLLIFRIVRNHSEHKNPQQLLLPFREMPGFDLTVVIR